MPIPFRLDYVIEKTLAEQNVERQTIKRLAGVKLSADEARTVWLRIVEHKWFVSERLGRDVGFRVATIDYFENIYGSHQTRRGAINQWMRRIIKPAMIA